MAILEESLAQGPVSVLTNGLPLTPERCRTLKRLSDQSEYSLDIRISRPFQFNAVTVEPIFEVFNLFNHTNLGTPERFVNTPQFGSIIMAATPARQIQFVLRYAF